MAQKFTSIRLPNDFIENIIIPDAKNSFRTTPQQIMYFVHKGKEAEYKEWKYNQILAGIEEEEKGDFASQAEIDRVYNK